MLEQSRILELSLAAFWRIHSEPGLIAASEVIRQITRNHGVCVLDAEPRFSTMEQHRAADGWRLAADRTSDSGLS